jgi:ribosomal-protein-alanine N-acetyltransferase
VEGRKQISEQIIARVQRTDVHERRLRIFSAYLFELRPIPRLQFGMFKGNAASRKVAEKCGYQYEGTQRQGNFLRGGYWDRETFSLLRSECPRLSEALPS